jgi:hypothetical protein
LRFSSVLHSSRENSRQEAYVRSHLATAPATPLSATGSIGVLPGWRLASDLLLSLETGKASTGNECDR